MTRRGKSVLYKIHQVRVLNTNDKAAKNILSVAAREVEPIMQKRQWQVLMLEEFCPVDTRFVGLYIRTESVIKLRLRKSINEKYMFHYDFIIGSLLHELAHIQYASHGPRFHALLKKLKHEYNMLYCTRVGIPITINDQNETIDSQTYGSTLAICEVDHDRCATPMVCIDVPEKIFNTKKSNQAETVQPIVILANGKIEETSPQVKKTELVNQTKTEEVIDVETYAVKNSEAFTKIKDNNEGEKENDKRQLEEVEEVEEVDQGKKRRKWNVPDDQIIVID